MTIWTIEARTNSLTPLPPGLPDANKKKYSYLKGDT